MCTLLILGNVSNCFAYIDKKGWFDPNWHENNIGYRQITKAELETDALYNAGLFNGTLKGYELDKTATRAEAVTMLVRLIGAEDIAKTSSYEIPFNDVPEWAIPYVGYAYENGLTKGVSSDKYGSDQLITQQQYAAFMLRALGFSEEASDFSFSNAVKIFNDKCGEVLCGNIFYRKEMVLMSYNALSSPTKDKTPSLAQKLGVGFVQTLEIREDVDSTSIWGVEYPLVNGTKRIEVIENYPEQLYLMGRFAYQLNEWEKESTGEISNSVKNAKGYYNHLTVSFKDMPTVEILNSKMETDTQYWLAGPCLDVEDSYLFMLGNSSDLLYLGVFYNIFSFWWSNVGEDGRPMESKMCSDVLFLEVR